MKVKRKEHLPVIILLVVIFTTAPMAIRAQMKIGQYLDEAPFRTWNTLGISSGRILGMGNVRFAMPSGVSAALVNPALLTEYPKFTFSFSGSINSASIYRYGIVNTGVLFSLAGNLFARQFLFDQAGLTFNWNEWGLGINFGALETYIRPSALYEEEWKGSPYYTIEYLQKGLLHNLNFSLAKRISSFLSIGIGVNSVFGNWEKSVVEHWALLGRRITDNKSQNFKGIFFNAGFIFHLNEKWLLSAIIQSPFTKKGDAQSLLRYEDPTGNTDIRIQAEARNTYNMPLVLGVGTSYSFSERFRAGADISFFNWSKYTLRYFDEDFDRSFKNIIKVNAGLEYFNFIMLFRKRIKTFLRTGFIYDPQPIQDLDSHYLYLTLGTGFRLGKFSLDVGMMIGKEYGSGNGLFAQKSIITATYELD